jgi:hypothetical protein
MYARDINKLEKWIGAWISAEKETYKSPLSIVVPTDWWPVENKAQQELVESFVADLEATHEVQKTEISIKDLWREKTPAKADSSDLTKYLENVSGMTPACATNTNGYKGWRHFILLWRLRRAASVPGGLSRRILQGAIRQSNHALEMVSHSVHERVQKTSGTASRSAMSTVICTPIKATTRTNNSQGGSQGCYGTATQRCCTTLERLQRFHPERGPSGRRTRSAYGATYNEPSSGLSGWTRFVSYPYTVALWLKHSP